MTASLKVAFDKASSLPDEEQEALAALILEELASEERWRAAFARRPDALAKLAAEALAEDERGETKDLEDSL